MGDTNQAAPTADEQRAAHEARQKELAQERVERREKLGQAPRPEPALDDSSED